VEFSESAMLCLTNTNSISALGKTSIFDNSTAFMLQAVVDHTLCSYTYLRPLLNDEIFHSVGVVSSVQEVYRGHRLPDLRNHHLVQASVRPGKYEGGQINVRARLLQGHLPPAKHAGYVAQRYERIRHRLQCFQTGRPLKLLETATRRRGNIIELRSSCKSNKFMFKTTAEAFD
jgi:hypothetical protein